MESKMRGRPSTGRKTKSRAKAAKSARGRSSKSKKASKSRKTTKTAEKRKTSRKQPARATKKTSRKMSARAPRGRQRAEVFGEGNYTASREFRRGQAGFARRNKRPIPETGEQAAEALEGSEGNASRQAEEPARAHSAGEES